MARGWAVTAAQALEVGKPDVALIDYASVRNANVMAYSAPASNSYPARRNISDGVASL
jgi:hypothetical protein